MEAEVSAWYHGSYHCWFIVETVQCTTSTVPRPVYIAISVSPIKALCAERCSDWTQKFSSFGLLCKELTGDTELDDFQELRNVHIIITTPVSDAVHQ